jgi:hypothetical protein
MRIVTAISACLLIGVCAACAPDPPPNDSGLRAVTAAPTLDENNPAALCASINDSWGRDWQTAIRALEALYERGDVCPEAFSIPSRLYTAYISFGTILEQRGQRQPAIDAYRRALDFNFNGPEAQERLRRLEVATPLPPQGCNQEVVSAAIRGLPAYEPTEGAFVRMVNDAFTVDGAPFTIYGVNYSPRDYPGDRLLAEMDVESIAFELDLMRASGLNVLRVYLRHDDLFRCPGNGAVPVVAAFERLDGLIQAAAERDFRLILVMNHDADLTTFPLYDSLPHNAEQMAFIAARYRVEPAVFAYDLRALGDFDYTNSNAFTRDAVLAWLAGAAAIVRQSAPNQYVTAGWLDEAEVTAPLVDFVSFQHYGDVDSLRQKIAILQDATDRPILLASVGYNTFDLDEIGQRQAYQRAFEAVEQNRLVGWIVWTAFDYPLDLLCEEPNCPAPDGPSNRYGLWNTSYFPKRALDAVELATGVRDEIEP